MNRWVCGICAVASSLAAACSTSSEGSGTTGKTIQLRTVLVVAQDVTQPMTNALGWEVTLSKAYLSVGALYYFQGDPVISLRTRPRKSPLLQQLGDLLEKPAYAHPGHYIPGEAMGEMTVSTTVDLLNRATSLASGTGVTGMTSSARFTWLAPPQGPFAQELDGHVVLVEGVAKKGDTTLPFLAKADQADVLDGNQLPEVDGCTFGIPPGIDGIDMEGDGTVTLTVVPSVWFDQVDFSYVVSTDSGVTEAPSGSVDIGGTVAFRGFVRGLKKGTAYLFSYAR